ncbi:hypothetical protein [Massilia sp.]|uniref:hypothetical protein n=1 Tax=Massilia sp. TaxID=1882437 RepID=UPI00289E6BD2|nr:hypothetical protein [Massilia sp.]
MRILLPAVAVVASLAACGGSGEGNADTKLAGTKIVPGTKVFKSMDSLQCSGGGVPLSALQAQLAAANIQVQAAECGNDGRPTPAVCGVSDGRIGIFEIPVDQGAVAAAAGFKPLTTLPGAKTIPCA